MKKKKKNIHNLLFTEYFINYQNPSGMFKKLRMTEGRRNEDQVYVIKKVLDKMKKTIKNGPENRTFKIEDNKKIINIVECILYFNQPYQSGKGL